MTSLYEEKRGVLPTRIYNAIENSVIKREGGLWNGSDFNVYADADVLSPPASIQDLFRFIGLPI